MKKLIWFTVLNTAAMVLLIASRIGSEKDRIDWVLIAIAFILIIVNLVHFFVERDKLNKLK
ncbi:hypothetical protein [Psychroserpens jangbogonensis]|uniref:hypothetical protein n=1 Tax=Psychroserpens jangbogonensis TaxID=1484460 RepID=UPI00053DBB97|nr:hypothetical protein [Psychroserpens jangbogonensis]